MTATDERLGQSELETEKAEADDLTLWSVTTIIGALDKPGLLYWAAEQTAEAAIDSERTWKAMLADRGRGEAVKWLRTSVDRVVAGDAAAIRVHLSAARSRIWRTAMNLDANPVAVAWIEHLKDLRREIAKLQDEYDH